MTHLCVKNTIDAAIYNLQDNKQESIDAALDDSNRKESITPFELMSLFGKVSEDENGRPFIFAHDGRHDDDERIEDESMRSSPPSRAPERESEDEDSGFMRRR
jgi:hypothetical protein